MTLEQFFGPDRQGELGQGRALGLVVGGSLTEGLEIRLNDGVAVEEMAVGRHVVVEGRQMRFYGMITDVGLGLAREELARFPLDFSDPFIARVMEGTATYGRLHVAPQLVLEQATGLASSPKPVKTVPPHFALVREASEADVAAVFGEEDERHFHVGNPLDMETKVCLDLRRLVERSTGVFGKSGTGKTMLTRLLLIGILQKSGAVSLVFDMHNEYGWEGSAEGGGTVKALKQLHPAKVAIFTLDEASSRRRGVHPDFVVEIGYDEIEPADIEILSEALHLTEKAPAAAYALQRHFRDGCWLRELLECRREEIEALANEMGEHGETVLALRRRLEVLRRFKCFVPSARDKSFERILSYLERGTHVVLEFGGYRDLTVYMLVANLLSRRIHQRYVEGMERYAGEGGKPPLPLVIAIEEAHKFLHPKVSRQTIFGEIAREMRKYNVTLLVVDQRPSEIDDEVMSQIGTRVTFLLDDERDINAVLSGQSGKSQLQPVLARLETQRQALVLGHAVPMPVVVQVREYGSPDSYQGLGGFDGGAKSSKRAKEELW